MTRPHARAAGLAAACVVIALGTHLAAAAGERGGAAATLAPMPALLDPAALKVRRAGTSAVADGFIAAARRSARCQAGPIRLVRSAPGKYALGRCTTARRTSSKRLPRPRTRLLRETAFASVIADTTCVTAWCASAAAASRSTWVIVSGRAGVHPRTTASCPRYKNIDFATDTAIPEDRMPRLIPKGRQVLWRYASRGGGWVMAHWSRGGAYAWAFIPRSCVADPPTWTEIALWRHDHRAAGRHRPAVGRRFRLLRAALPCASRLRCRALPGRP